MSRTTGLVLLSAWCGLAAGLLEVAARVAGVAIHPVGRLYLVSRHFVWAGPLSNLVLFLLIGLILALAAQLSPRVGGWFAQRLLCALTVLPALIAGGPRIYPWAWSILALGLAVQVVPLLAQSTSTFQRCLWWSFPAMVLAVAGLAGSVFLGDRLKEARALSRSVPPAGSANVLLIVLDTVRADHLSLYGYHRPTTPNIDRLAARGIRFDEVRASAPWTLPSHATMFTGRWPHELGAEWQTPLLKNPPTLAQYLSAQGYATAGFVGNVGYCSYATHLDRGFTHYEDFVLHRLAVLRTAGLVEYAVRTFLDFADVSDKSGLIGQFRKMVIRWFAVDERKPAAAVNRSFLDWLSRPPSAGRPFFVFLNYIDAHASYLPPPGTIHRFGSVPPTPDAAWIVYKQWSFIDKTKLLQPFRELGRDAYDDCLGYMDDQVGSLMDTLERHGELDHTLVIITSDHGEGFGEHDLFDHGESLYRPEIHVPLVIVPPGSGHPPQVVHKTVSLRDLPATIVDLVGLAEGSPFPGKSLARTWRRPDRSDGHFEDEWVLSELTGPNPLNPNFGRSPAVQGPLMSIADGDFVYIRNEKDGSEQLFDIKDDPRELTNRAGNDRFQAVLERFRAGAHTAKPPR